MNAIDFISIFDREATNFILLDDAGDVLYSGNGRRCMAWLSKNANYDIFPDNGGYWAGVENNQIVIYLTEIFE